MLLGIHLLLVATDQGYRFRNQNIIIRTASCVIFLFPSFVNVNLPFEL